MTINANPTPSHEPLGDQFLGLPQIVYPVIWPENQNPASISMDPSLAPSLAPSMDPDPSASPPAEGKAAAHGPARLPANQPALRLDLYATTALDMIGIFSPASDTPFATVNAILAEDLASATPESLNPPYRLVTPEFYAFLRSRMQVAKLVRDRNQEKLPTAVWDHMRARFNDLHVYAVNRFGEEALLAAVAELEAGKVNQAKPEERKSAA